MIVDGFPYQECVEMFINDFFWIGGSPSFKWGSAEFLPKSGELVYFLNLVSFIRGVVYRFF